MNFIVVLEPSRQQSDYGLSIRQDRQPSMIAFEGFDECLRDAVGFWRADWRETKLEPKAVAVSSVSLAMYAEPFNLKPWKPGQSGNLNCRPVGRGNALHGREATRSLLRYLCAAITEQVRVTVEQSLPGNLSIEDGATLRQVLFDMPRTMSDLSPQ